MNQLYIGLAFIGLSIPAYYYFVKVKNARRLSGKYNVYFCLNILGAIRISEYFVVDLSGTKDYGINWYLASLAFTVIISIVCSQALERLIGSPQPAKTVK